MPEDSIKTLPFLTRKMLDFEHGVTFSIRVYTQSNTNLPLFVRGVTKEGPFTFKHTPANSGVQSNSTFRIPDFPTWVSVGNETAALYQGDVWGSVVLLVNDTVYRTLCSGLIYDMKGISWPDPPQEDVMPGRGKIHKGIFYDPSAGNDIAIVVPFGRKWNIHGMCFTLATDANVAARRVHLRFGDYGIECFSSVDQAASLTRKYSCGQYAGLITDNHDDDIIIPFPANLWLGEQETISSQILNKQAGDDIDLVVLFREEFFVRAL